jgi:hypothetical protein
VGIFSLSETCENQLMWAHYADSSRGIAIGFEATKGSKLDSDEHCIKVNYSDELPVFKGEEGLNLATSFYADGKNIQKIAFIDGTFRQAVSTKPTCWEYEKEWRYIEENSGSYDFPGKLTEIVFGLKCPQDIRDNYIKLANDNLKGPIDLSEIVTILDTKKLIKRKYEP